MYLNSKKLNKLNKKKKKNLLTFCVLQFTVLKQINSNQNNTQLMLKEIKLVFYPEQYLNEQSLNLLIKIK